MEQQAQIDSKSREDKKAKYKKFKKNRKGKGQQKAANGVDQRGEKKPYDDIIMKNEHFEAYYREQKLMQSEDEFKLFIESLRQSLPSAFRISSFCTGQSEMMRELLKSNFIHEMYANTTDVVLDHDKGQQALPDDFSIAPLSWYPHQLAWTFNISKMQIRKTPILAKLHRFLVAETATGDISRQEAVSMIPPLLLDIHPGQTILDMCAAPGSKTAQLIEMLHQHSNDTFLLDPQGQTKPQPELDGLVVANDVDNRRCYMLVHQSKRLNSPAVVIINHDASQMPNMYRTTPDGAREKLKFDRILADVPCTGDGTIRKNYEIWRKWKAFNSNSLHPLQVCIAKRGLEMLKKHGLMVYSTCSFNPVENEAVVAELLRLSQGDLELVDVGHLLPGLIRHPGLSTWKVMPNEKDFFEQYDQLPEDLRGKLRESLFQPSSEEAENMKLERCIRLLPHDQNTGGFFVAVLKKKTDCFAWEKPETREEVKLGETEVVEKKKKNNRFVGYREDPFHFFNDECEDWKTTKKYFKLPDTVQSNQLAHRASKGSRRSIYFFTKTAANFIMSNETNVKMINGGVRTFARHDVPVELKCAFRLTQEGIVSLGPYIANQIGQYEMGENAQENENETFKVIQLDKLTFVKLVKAEEMKMNEFDDALLKRFNRLEPFNSIMVYVKLDRPEGKGYFLLPICAWRGRNSVRAYVAKNERAHYLQVCGAEVGQGETIPAEQGQKRKLSQTEATEERIKAKGDGPLD